MEKTFKTKAPKAMGRLDALLAPPPKVDSHTSVVVEPFDFKIPIANRTYTVPKGTPVQVHKETKKFILRVPGEYVKGRDNWDQHLLNTYHVLIPPEHVRDNAGLNTYQDLRSKVGGNFKDNAARNKGRIRSRK